MRKLGEAYLVLQRQAAEALIINFTKLTERTRLRKKIYSTNIK